jgi:hypothetical protein
MKEAIARLREARATCEANKRQEKAYAKEFSAEWDKYINEYTLAIGILKGTIGIRRVMVAGLPSNMLAEVKQ